MQQCLSIKAPVDISTMRSIAAIIYNAQQPVAFLNVSNAAQSVAVFALQMRFGYFIIRELGNILV